MSEIFQETRSVCPLCLRPLNAKRIKRGQEVSLYRECPDHGAFQTPIWRGRVDFDSWCGGAESLPQGIGLHCPEGCGRGICPEHEQETCCALLEVTRRCNLHCRFCFARGGEGEEEPSLEELKQIIARIMEKGKRPLLQLSGGEPSLRDDLPQLIRFAKELGCPYVQLNTNGIRLAEDEAYVRELSKAGLSFVFLQFDGVTEEVYGKLRGRELYETKLRAIRNCDANHLGVTLVPTVVRGINENQLGDIIRLGALLSPGVRGVHFQPVSYFGRYPGMPRDEERYTLDELVADICCQTGLSPEDFVPSRCDHPLCGFHGSFLAEEKGRLTPLGRETADCCKTDARQNREYVGRHWSRREEACGCTPCGCDGEALDMDAFLDKLRTRSFTLTAMAFQDAMNLDVERLHRCSLHVYDQGVLKPFCARYLTPVREISVEEESR